WGPKGTLTMGLFKSREERRIERDIQVRQGVASVKRQIANQTKNEKEYLVKARRAKQMGSMDQAVLLRQTLKRTIASRIQMERQLLAIETAAQMKNQAESYSAFAKSMTAVSRSIAEVFGATDLARTQQEFERAMAQAQSMEQRMAVFLDMTNETMGSMEIAGGEELVNDAELDRMISAEAAQEERGMDDDIARGLKEIERELSKDK
ncbi:MAG: hypothetical protein NTY46_16755, partial [Candidatus Sumerlaeota bacterium]|nr:hypothetical protein [Candidatus Sumerlaeota bacterium]